MAHGLTATADEEQYDYPQAHKTPHISPRHTASFPVSTTVSAAGVPHAPCAGAGYAAAGAQHQIVDTEKHPDIEQSQGEQGGIIAVGDEVVVPQPIHEPQQRHMDK